MRWVWASSAIAGVMESGPSSQLGEEIFPGHQEEEDRLDRDPEGNVVETRRKGFEKRRVNACLV